MKALLYARISRMGTPTLLMLGLLGLALLSSAWTLSQNVRGLDLELLVTMVLGGAIAGWLVARSRVRGIIALPLLLAIAVVLVLVRVGQLGAPFLALSLALARLGLRSEITLAAWQSVTLTFEPLRAALPTLINRIVAWGYGIAVGPPIVDLTALAFVWCFAVVGFAMWAAWFLRRKQNPLLALAPSLFLLAWLLAYTGRNPLILVLPAAALLGLLVVVPHLARQLRWEHAQISSADDLGKDLALVAVPTILCILTAAAVVPALSPTQFETWVQQWTQPGDAQSGALPDSLGLVLAPQPTTVFTRASAPGLPRSHLIGAGPQLLRELALTVRMETPTPPTSSRYWLGSTYDIYTSRGWMTSALETRDYRANERADLDAVPEQLTLHQTVRLARDQGLVFAAGNLVSIDRAYQVAWREHGDMFGAQVQAREYGVESFVPAYSANQLRAAGTAYPDWVTARYLSLPESVPPRVLALARDLTATLPTPYARAVAISDYLRQIPYTLDLPAPPSNRDVVDYFLFDLKRGYCDYYASAMVVLARAAGLPARIAVGYAGGDYDPAAGTYSVREADAHSWAQVYFSEYGWVDFEPTGGRGNLSYETGTTYAEMTPPFRRDGESAAPGILPGVQAQSGWFIVPAIFLFALAALLWLTLLEGIVLGRLPAPSAASLLYHRVCRAARALGLPVNPSHTPHQVGALLEANLYPESSERLRDLRHNASAAVGDVIELYVQTTYGGNVPPRDQVYTVIRNWRRAQVYLWLAILAHYLARAIGLIRVSLGITALGGRASDSSL